MEVFKNLQQFTTNGLVKYENLLSIPLRDRLPGLVDQYGTQKIHGLLVVILTEFCNFYNVVRPMTAEQIVSCAFDLINTANEDYLSIEDLTIFFQGAKSGKYGKIYDRLDQQTIFDMLEIYRQERHQKYMAIKEEKDANYKSMGPNFRSSEDTKDLKDLFHQANLAYYKEQQTKNPE